MLVELTRNCPHLQKFAVYNNNEVTEQSVLALAVHCSQLREMCIHKTTLTEDTVRQLTQHCRHLTELRVRVKLRENVYANKKFTKRDIKALREHA